MLDIHQELACQIRHEIFKNVQTYKMANIVDTLVSYKKLSENRSNHSELLKDKTVILYTATLLENGNGEIVNLCLDILGNFIENDLCHVALMTTFGIFESLQSLAINSRSTNVKVAGRAAAMSEILQKSAPPAYGTRLRTNLNRNHPRSTTMMYHLSIPELTQFNRAVLDETLVSIKGMVSFVVDVEEHRCTIRTGSRLTAKSVVEKIMDATDMKALVVTKNRLTGVENLVDVLQDLNQTAPPEYVADDESSPGKDAIYYFRETIVKNAGGLLRSATDFLNKSFYW